MENNIIESNQEDIEIISENHDKSKYISISIAIIFILILATFFIYYLFVNNEDKKIEQTNSPANHPVQNISPEQELINCIKITKTDSSENALFNLGLAYINNKMYKESIKVYKKIILKNPNNANAFNNIGFAYGCMNDWDNGIKNCMYALQVDSNFQLAKNNLKWFLEEKNKANKK